MWKIANNRHIQFVTETKPDKNSKHFQFTKCKEIKKEKLNRQQQDTARRFIE